jgi:hypothetical protein
MAKHALFIQQKVPKHGRGEWQTYENVCNCNAICDRRQQGLFIFQAKFQVKITRRCGLIIFE